MIRYLVFALLVFIGISGFARAELKLISFRDLVTSDSIVYARVERIIPVGRQWRTDKQGNKFQMSGLSVAQAKVVRVFQGKGISVGQAIYIAAFRTWECDATHLAQGEEAMLFLDKKKARLDGIEGYVYPNWSRDFAKYAGEAPLYSMVYSGQGKLSASFARGNISLRVDQTSDSGGPTMGFGLTLLRSVQVTWNAGMKTYPDGTAYREGHVSVEVMERFLTQLKAERNTKKVARGRG